MTKLNLRIRGRLYGGFGALVAFGMLAAGFTTWQLSEITTGVNLMALQSEYAMRAVQLSSELQAVRRALLRYQFDHDEPSFAEAEKRLADVGSMVEDGIKRASAEDRRAIYRELQGSVAELKAKRAALGDAVKSFVTGRDALFKVGVEMTDDIDKFSEAAKDTAFARFRQ
ncbi:hypothetical protein [Bradyrhizobium sp.]|jgi:hypothetical protein|uniref:hypothetical protein n=1 Tax=Bradyrhizobium sp. TaxID=376 RepID=UPI003C24BFCE